MTAVVKYRKYASTKLHQLEKRTDLELPKELLDQFETIVNVATEVKKILGDGWYEEVYQNALAVELRLRGFEAEREVPLDAKYKGETVGTVRPDILVRGEHGFVIEVKRGDMFRGVHQLVQYMKLCGLHVGYLIGFQEEKLTVWPIVSVECENDGSEVYVCELTIKPSKEDVRISTICVCSARRVLDVGVLA